MHFVCSTVHRSSQAMGRHALSRHSCPSGHGSGVAQSKHPDSASVHLTTDLSSHFICSTVHRSSQATGRHALSRHSCPSGHGSGVAQSKHPDSAIVHLTTDLSMHFICSTAHMSSQAMGWHALSRHSCPSGHGSGELQTGQASSSSVHLTIDLSSHFALGIMH